MPNSPRAFWNAAQNFRAAVNEEERHKARVVLLKLALCDNAVGDRAADALLEEGMIFFRHDNNVEALKAVM